MPPALNEARSDRKPVILAVCCLSLFIAQLDLTIVNVALPSIRRSLHTSVSGLQWTIDAYALVIASLLMLSGSLADRIGRRRVFQTGLAIFALGSLLCSLAPSLGWLVAFRGVQAVGGSMLNPVAMSIIVTAYTDGRARARAVGIWGAVGGLSMAIGPVIGGVLVSTIGWRSIFWINVPIGLAAIVLTQRFVPESRATRARRLDPAAQVLIVVMLASITYAIIEGPNRGWTSSLIVGLFVVSLIAGAALVAVGRRRREPLIDIRFFHSVPFSGANLIAVAAFACLGGFLFLNTLYLQDVRHYSAVHAGAMTIPLAVMFGVFATVSGRLVGSRGPRLPLVLAGVMLTMGAVLLARLTAHTSLGDLVVTYMVFGTGCGLVTAPITNTAMSGMPSQQAGVAGAVASTSRQVGAALGVAVCGSLVARTHGLALLAASHGAWLVIAGCGCVVVVLAFASTGDWALGTAERSGRRLGEEALDQAPGRLPAPSS